MQRLIGFSTGLSILFPSFPFLITLFPMKTILFLVTGFLLFGAEGIGRSQDRSPKDLSFRYQRDHFEHWVDRDGDCQNTRAELLVERSEAPVRYRKSKRGNCSVLEGKWQDFYFAETLTKADKVDIDHVVPLKHAWDAGAKHWSSEKREEFANDPMNLVITNRKYNRQKGAKTILEWMPVDRQYACKYAKLWMEVKEKYSLQIQPQEKEYVQMLKCSSAAGK